MTDSANRIGPFVVERVLGEGGMGRVYLAVGPDGEHVAVKLVRSELASDETYMRRFHREARVAARVIHPHVVRVVEAGEHEGVPYLAQEFIRGGSLDKKLEAEGRLDLGTTVAICAQVAEGLDALHEVDLVHRDVKPPNILLDEQGSAYVSDFGLAKDRAGTLLTKPGQAIGSLDYMAPEQIRAEEVTAATDVYGLACVMCECLSGSPPFADRGGMRVLWAHLQDEPPDPCAGRPDLPSGLGAVIRQGLEKDPGKRPQTATAFARMTQEAVARA